MVIREDHPFLLLLPLVLFLVLLFVVALHQERIVVAVSVEQRMKAITSRGLEMVLQILLLLLGMVECVLLVLDPK